MAYLDLRAFMADLESKGLLKRIKVEVDSNLEITEISDRVVKSAGPALLFEKVKGSRPGLNWCEFPFLSGWRSGWYGG